VKLEKEIFMNEKRLENYASVLVKVGSNIQPGQIMVLQVFSEELPLARAITKAAFAAGAKDVIVFIEDIEIKHTRALYADKNTLREVPQCKKDLLDYYLKQDCVQMCTFTTFPSLMDGVSMENAMALSQADNELRNVIRHYIHDGTLPWTGTIWPNSDWAKKVYPQLSESDAFAQLEEDFCLMLRVKDDNDPVAEWHDHCAHLRDISDTLDSYNFKSLHITTGIGTDITMDLVKNHLWSGGAASGDLKTRAPFVANMPTEEVATDPDFRTVNGTAVASFPLMMSGKLVKDFSITFKDGLASDCKASENEEVLRETLFIDDSTRALGEVALVSKYSPIKLLQRIFYNGLIDENAASHLAFGSSFASGIKGGTDMSKEELLQHGVNQSTVHVDFMIGTDDMRVVGTTFAGDEIVIMDQGDFVIAKDI